MRRSAALLYDSLLLLGALFAATAAALLFNQGQAVAPSVLRIAFLVIVYGFYVGFWVHGGQTLGMRAWRLKLVDDAGETPRVLAASQRFAAAAVSWGLLGIGHWWIAVDAQRLAWHDRWSRTYVVDTRRSAAVSDHPPQ